MKEVRSANYFRLWKTMKRKTYKLSEKTRQRQTKHFDQKNIFFVLFFGKHVVQK